MSCALQHAPRLQLSFDGLEIALEENIVHDPAVEEALRDYPQQHPQTFMLKDIGHNAHTGVDGKEEQVIEEYLQRIAGEESDEHQYIRQW